MFALYSAPSSVSASQVHFSEIHVHKRTLNFGKGPQRPDNLHFIANKISIKDLVNKLHFLNRLVVSKLASDVTSECKHSHDNSLRKATFVFRVR